MTIVKVKVLNVHYHGTSTIGNPTMDIVTTEGEIYRTSSNSSSGYSADNFHPRFHNGEPVEVELGLTAAGRVKTIKYAS